MSVCSPCHIKYAPSINIKYAPHPPVSSSKPPTKKPQFKRPKTSSNSGSFHKAVFYKIPDLILCYYHLSRASFCCCCPGCSPYTRFHSTAPGPRKELVICTLFLRCPTTQLLSIAFSSSGGNSVYVYTAQGSTNSQTVASSQQTLLAWCSTGPPRQHGFQFGNDFAHSWCSMSQH